MPLPIKPKPCGHGYTAYFQYCEGVFYAVLSLPHHMMLLSGNRVINLKKMKDNKDTSCNSLTCFGIGVVFVVGNIAILTNHAINQTTPTNNISISSNTLSNGKREYQRIFSISIVLSYGVMKTLRLTALPHTNILVHFEPDSNNTVTRALREINSTESTASTQRQHRSKQVSLRFRLLLYFIAHLNFGVTVESHMEELKALWEEIKLSYDQCLQDIEADGDDEDDQEGGKEGINPEKASELETVKGKYRSAYTTYCRCNARLKEILSDHFSPRVNPNPQSVTSHAVHIPIPEAPNGFKLPPCEIPTFKGDFSTWPTFRDIFKAVCLNNPRLSSVEKLFHLTRRTQGEPHDIVKSLARYENKRVLVNIQLKNLFSLPVITAESGATLKKLQRDMNSSISLLKQYGIEIETWDPIFTFICSNRLPDSTLTLWEQTLSDKTAIPKWSELDTFLTNRHKTLESVSEIRKQEPNPTNRLKLPTGKSTNRGNPSNVKTFQNNISEPKCTLCPKEFHIIRKCPKFLKMDPSQRFSEIKANGMCINCFSKVHTVKSCNSKYSCRFCNKKHNTLLHKPQNEKPNSTELNPSAAVFPSTSSSIQSTSRNETVHSCFSTSSRGVLLGTALVKICHSGLTYTARALVDSGSEGTFVSQKLFNILKLPFRRTSANISGLNNTVSAAVQKECSFVLGSNTDENIAIFTTALVVPHLSGNLPSRTFEIESLSKLPNIPFADPRFYESSTIDVLLGGDILPSIMLPGLKRDICGSLMAQETIFGWILTGPIPDTSGDISPNIVSYFCEISLDKEISRFWEIEDLPRKKFISASDQFCEDFYVRTTTRNNEGRYIVALPFKESYPNDVDLGQSKKIAMAQYFRNEARLIRTPAFKEEYDNVLAEYITLDHMSLVSPNSIPNYSKCYYLPHHAVIRPESVTTKVRVVFNASAPTSNGVSLNDVLHTGPILQNELIVLILNWRLFQYVFNGDITKMYRQILVNPSQRSFQRILFRKNPQNPLEDFELKTVTFGVNCAPYLAIRTMLQLADDVQHKYPKASEILRNFMYVDDALAGSHTISEAIEARNQLILALKSAGFEMRKWTSNSKSILSDIPSSDLLHAEFLEFDDSSTAKALGIRWNALSDSFFFIVQDFPTSSTYTKREVLSQISKLFDPAGWLAPCLIVAKIIMQQIWVDGTGWDERITPESLKKWTTFQSNYPYVNSIKIPRWFNYSPDSEVQLHGFSDASEKAYAAALYIRIRGTNFISTHLVASKTKVAPIKTLSIPRLELCGATLLAEMIDHIVPQLRLNEFTVDCWTDSTIVLSWLSKPPCYWGTFVANRVSKITQIIPPHRWHHVSSELNPSDLASRGLTPRELIENELWWQGPPFLRSSEPNWPIFDYEDIDLERKPIKVNFTYFAQFDDVLDRFSSLPRAIRVIAYMYRFLYRTHPKYKSNFYSPMKDISTFEVLSIHTKLQVMCQKVHYPNEYHALSAKKNIASSSSLLSLNPFIDSEGIMRICGRLSASPALRYNERHPIIIPYNCQYSRLLVKFIHEICLHGGNQLVLRLIREQYWIPKAKNLIKTTINKCKPCILYKHRCQTQLMSALPPQRSEFSRPFTHTGLDFAGPFDIKSYSGRSCRISKGYTCVFVCFSTKAIHLEATSELSTSAFLAAFSRFVSRRGCPLHLYSDNGTNFVGASRTLAKEFLLTSNQLLSSNYVHQNVTWHFIPPGAPHMGGLWEAGVKSFKAHFKKVAANFKHTFEEFQTLLAKIEACLNSRPLSPCSQEPSDLSALTPGHFLIGTPLLAPIDPPIKDSPLSIVNRWQRLKVIHQHFCLRWKEEYLKELHKRHKWKRATDNLQENTMVVIREENLPPNCWRLGRIKKVYTGADNRVRVAEIITQKGIVTRPITKLVVLPIEDTV
ncbi:uncharacterized protein LOC142225136 [Haematobia irritans]|uniref:uncharacterized protein LOC142225136 n=1 Tax=Haematobia irritans TaxID=7368 RepID=UPI003F4F8418